MNKSRMKSENRKTEILSIRCTAKEKSLLERKARQKDKCISEYLIDQGIAGTERRSSKDKKRLEKMIENQEILNQLYDCINSSSSKQEMLRLLQQLTKGEFSLWEF